MGFDLSKVDDIELQRDKKKSVLKRDISFAFLFGFSNKKKEMFYTELGILLIAGLQLSEALKLLKQSFRNEKDKSMIEGILASIIEGATFSESLAMISYFSKYEYLSVKMGEDTGRLSTVVSELSLFFKRKNKQRRIIMNALSYPIVVLMTSFLAIAFMLHYIIPMFADIFKQNKVALPALTRFVISLSDIFSNYYWVFFLFIVLFLLSYNLVKNKQWFRKYYTCFLLKIPFFGELLRKTKLAQFCQSMSLLYVSNIPLLESITLIRRMISFYPIEISMFKVYEDLQQGISFSDSLDKIDVFDKRMIALVRVSEETNASRLVFQKLTEHYAEEIEYKTQLINSVIEPLIILILGGIVGLILVAMYLPIFSIGNTIY